MKYDEEFVLKNVSYAINMGDKIGVVGRTGSGKSTLVQMIFRMYDHDHSV